MDPLHRIAEKRIEEALARGEFDDYPGKGEPLALDDLSGLDPEMRQTYILLKGHGFVSDDVELRKNLVSLHALLAACNDDDERARLTDEQRQKRLRFALLLEKRGVPGDVIDRLANLRA